MNAYEVGSVVRSAVTTENLVQGESYVVAITEEQVVFFGTLVRYCLRTLDGAQRFWIAQSESLALDAVPARRAA